MNNWRLLLLAVVVVVQPIGSFTESNLIDGRECCERSEDARHYGYRKTEERRSLDGNREDRRQTIEERRLSSLDGNRDWRNEARNDPMVTRSESSLAQSERHISLEPKQFSREPSRRNRVTGLRVTRNHLEEQNRYRHEARSTMEPTERDSRESRNRNTLDAHTTRTHRLSGDDKRTRSVEREPRNLMSRLPIRTGRSIKDRSVSQRRETAILKREREDLILPDNRRDTRLIRSDSAIQLDDNRNSRVFDRRTQEDLDNRRTRFANGRVNENRAERAQSRTDELNERDSGIPKVVRVEMQRQRKLESRNMVSAVRRNSEGIPANRVAESRESARLVRDRYDTRDTRIDERRQGRESRRTLSMDRLSKLREFRDNGLSRASDSNTRRDENAARNRGSTDERRQERENNRLSREVISSLRKVRDSKHQMQESRRVITSREAGDFTKERVQRDDSHLSLERNGFSMWEARETKRSEKDRTIRKSSEEHRLHYDTSRRSRTFPMLRESSEVRDSADRSREYRHIANPSHAEINSRGLDSMDRRFNRNNQRSDLRRQVLERSMDRTIRMTRSSSAKQKHDFRESRVSRSAEELRDREDKMNNEPERHMSSRTGNKQFERVVKNRNEVRENDDRDISINRIGVLRATRNAADRIENRRSLRTESIRLERLIQNRAEVKNNERREVQRDEDGRISSVVLNSRSNERVFAERRLENRDATMDSRDVRSEMVRNRDEIRMVDSFVYGERDASNRASERLLAYQGRQEDREARRYSTNIRDEITRNRGVVRIERARAERRQESRAKDARDDVQDLVGARRARVLGERRDDSRRLARNSQNVRTETRNLLEASRERVQTEQRQENRDSRIVRNEIRINEALESRNRDVTRESKERESRDGYHRLTERSRESTVRPETRNERATKNKENSVQSSTFLRLSDSLREFRSDMRTNNAMELMGRTNRLASLFQERHGKLDTKREEIRFRTIDAATFRDPLDSVESDTSAFSNWQMTFYTLQGIYLCGLLVQMLTEKTNQTKTKTFNWWSSSKNLIKVD